MKKLALAFAGLCLLAAGSTLANDANVVRTHSLEVKERLGHLERIDVTAEKPASPDAEPLDAELQAMLDEIESLEAAAPEAAPN